MRENTRNKDKRQTMTESGLSKMRERTYFRAVFFDGVICLHLEEQIANDIIAHAFVAGEILAVVIRYASLP